MNELTAQAQIKEAVGLLHAKQHPSMILIIVSPRAQRFIHLARWACDIIHGVPSIEVKDDWLTRNDQDLYGKIALRMNLKLGGQNHSVDPADLGCFANRSTMIVGVTIESVPATKGGASTVSIIGIVASSGHGMSQWPADISIQARKTGLLHCLNTLIESRLHSWREEHGNRMPEDVVIFHSVESDGDDELWVEQELPLLPDMCKKMALGVGQHGPLPRITIVLVDEHHDARFFPTADTESSKFGQSLAGTVVDRGITQPGCWDFFLQPLGLMRIENRPVRYFVIFDEVFRRRSSFPNACLGPADLLQDLTHKLCYLPGESTRAQGVCSPIHYARQACARMRSYLHLTNCTPLASNFDGSVDSSRVELHSMVRNTMFYL
ncbi:Piwi-domain-containing protein [Penicillium subrubescens]|uniref:Piwi-domain-containing protein n=1 Tax=Penicillium subrubescens TaxID=1316194 RepID=UPI002544EC23|nr:Piwi-domain-containing protein [Penicillium subrubescens]KAJ5882745.1 Piwi-domain-containing protein [Penicillium subrubescens]